MVNIYYPGESQPLNPTWRLNFNLVLALGFITQLGVITLGFLNLYHVSIYI